jgi:hypothetical protein
MHMGLAAAIIGKTEFPMRVGLIQDRTNTIVKIRLIYIIDRHNDRDKRLLRETLNLSFRVALFIDSNFQIMLQRGTTGVSAVRVETTIKPRIKPSAGPPVPGKTNGQVVGEQVFHS